LPSGFCEGIVIVLPLIVALIGPTVKKLSEKALPIITAVISAFYKFIPGFCFTISSFISGYASTSSSTASSAILANYSFAGILVTGSVHNGAKCA
jgi:hypothetical protein